MLMHAYLQYLGNHIHTFNTLKYFPTLPSSIQNTSQTPGKYFPNPKRILPTKPNLMSEPHHAPVRDELYCVICVMVDTYLLFIW